MTYVPFNQIHLLAPGDPIAWEGPTDTMVGYVDHVKPGEYVSIFNGTGP